MKTRPAFLAAATAAGIALAAAGGSVLAQEHGHGRPDWARGHGEPGLDVRYHHDRWYPSRGYVSAALPVGALTVGWHGGNYFYHGGVWWRPWGGRYVVVAPPPGIFLPVLPAGVVTLWIGGAPYYYANGVYYSQVVGQGYQVVVPPPGADTAQPVVAPPPPAAAPDPIYYPRNGQSPAQTETDRRECNSWATTQPQAMSDGRVFQRAVEACMDGRGYTVR